MDLIVENCNKIFVEDLLFLVGDDEEPLVGLVQFLLGKIIAELRETVLQAVASGARGEHDAAFGEADIFGAHDLVRLAVLQKAVDVDAGAVGERVGSHDGLVGRNLHAEHVGNQAAGAVEFPRVDAVSSPK